jgi:hypothetical protein
MGRLMTLQLFLDEIAFAAATSAVAGAGLATGLLLFGDNPKGQQP